MDKKGKNTEYVSVTELAAMLKISRVAVFKKIKKGQIPARMIGRSYAISMDDVRNYMGGAREDKLTEENKKEIEEAVGKTVKEYGETLKLLGKE